MEEIAKLKGTLEMIASSIKDPSVYKVKQGDSLEKIAKANNVTVDALKKYNRLENDLIVVGQELKIPR
ncbi:MAG: LysM peptidoglycan-binding domain-containing protein [Chlamydiae bacterium]|nr:LysM peptidoglycan-binding domain-containing protein [Chlamydiota bacterium]